MLSANGGKPPRVLDMFAGGGAIPLEAARLGCEATAVELNPVAHLIELCMLDYPQRFGPSLADDVREWGERWVERGLGAGRASLPAGERQPSADAGDQLDLDWRGSGRARADARSRTCGPGPCAARTRRSTEHGIPLVRQTWLARKKGRYVALQPVVDEETLTCLAGSWSRPRSADELGFDPAGFSKRGKATCFVLRDRRWMPTT